MSKRPRRNHSSAFKAKVALEALKQTGRAGTALSGASWLEHRREKAAVGECGRDFQP